MLLADILKKNTNTTKVLKLPANIDTGDDIPISGDNTLKPKRSGYDFTDNDKISSFNEQQIDFQGMKVDRMFFSSLRKSKNR